MVPNEWVNDFVELIYDSSNDSGFCSKFNLLLLCVRAYDVCSLDILISNASLSDICGRDAKPVCRNWPRQHGAICQQCLLWEKSCSLARQIFNEIQFSFNCMFLGRNTFSVLVSRLLGEAGERGVRVRRRDLQKQVSTASGIARPTFEVSRIWRLLIWLTPSLITGDHLQGHKRRHHQPPGRVLRRWVKNCASKEANKKAMAL